MAGVDLSLYRFDYDLTFAVLFMNADGTIYHTYGGRDFTDAQSYLSMTALVAAMRRTLVEHERYMKDPSPPKVGEPTTVEEIPAMAHRIESGNAPKCFHCHMVRNMRFESEMAKGAFTRERIWVHPDPREIGVVLDREDQTRVAEVIADSAAAAAGLEPGDRLVSLGGRGVLTFSDIQDILHDTAGAAGRLDIVWTRGEEKKKGRLRLASGWKEADPRVYAWRPSKWPLSPKPGFGGRQLGPDEVESHGLPRDAFAFVVTYVVTWGPNAHTGRNARKAGIRKGDVVVSVAGKSDFDSLAHFHAWFRLTQKAGTTVDAVRIRAGKRTTLHLDVVP